MSPLFVTTENRGRPAPGDPEANRVRAGRLFELAGQIEALMEAFTEELSFEDHDALREAEVKLLAFGNPLMASDPVAFLPGETRLSSDLIEPFRDRLG